MSAFNFGLFVETAWLPKIISLWRDIGWRRWKTCRRMVIMLILRVCAACMSPVATSHHMIELVELFAYVVPEWIFEHLAVALAQFQTRERPAEFSKIAGKPLSLALEHVQTQARP